MKAKEVQDKIRQDNNKYFDDELSYLEKEKEKIFSILGVTDVPTFKYPSYLEVNLSCNTELISIGHIMNSCSSSGLLFRGQNSSDYQLIPSLYRGLSRDKMNNREIINFTMSLQGKQYSNFREAANNNDVALISTELCEEMLRWQYGQHYGLHTGYLDWTEDFFIALYFSCSHVAPKTNAVSLFTLNAKAIDVLRVMMELMDVELGIENNSVLLSEADKIIITNNDFDDFLTQKKRQEAGFLANMLPVSHELFFPKVCRPNYSTNPRAKAQKGFFTNLLYSFHLEDWFNSFVPYMEKRLNRCISTLPLIIKINLPVDTLSDFLLLLEKECDINQASLLLDKTNDDKKVLSIAEECNRKINCPSDKIINNGCCCQKKMEKKEPGFKLNGLVRIV